MLQYLGKYPVSIPQSEVRSLKSTVHIPCPNDRVKCDLGYLFTFKTVVNGIDSNQNQKMNALQVSTMIFKNISYLFLTILGEL